MQKPNPQLNVKPANIAEAVNAATLGVLGEISEMLEGIDCSLRALALIARDTVAGLTPDVLKEVNELLNPGEDESEEHAGD